MNGAGGRAGPESSSEPAGGLGRDRRRLGDHRRLGREGTHRTRPPHAGARGRPHDRSRTGLHRTCAPVPHAVPRLERPQGARRRAARAARVLRLRRDGPEVLRQRHREPVHDARREALPVDPGAPGRRALDHVGAAVVPPQRPRLRGQRARRDRGRLADPLLGPRPVVRARRGVRRHQRPGRGPSPTAGRRPPASHADDLRRERGEGGDRARLRRHPDDDDRAHGRPHPRPQGTERLPLLRPLPPRLHHEELLQFAQRHPPRRRGHRPADAAPGQRRAQRDLGSGPRPRHGRARH